jgi:hypothetical protein
MFEKFIRKDEKDTLISGKEFDMKDFISHSWERSDRMPFIKRLLFKIIVK